jgi:hypothetical protein
MLPGARALSAVKFDGISETHWQKTTAWMMMMVPVYHRAVLSGWLMVVKWIYTDA